MKTKLIFSTIAVLLSPIFRISAQTLENIPGQTAVTDPSDLVGYLNNLYKFGISITGILAIFMIALGSFAYIVTSAGNSSKMLNAKETIQNALIGLVIALSAYLFLFVINPDLVGGTLQAPEKSIESIRTTGSLPTGTSATTNPAEIGCCLWNLNANCSGGTTRAFCDGQGSSSFTVGNNLTCQAVAGSSSTQQCVAGSSTSPSSSPSDIGCCVFPGSNPSFTNACTASITRLNCDSTTGGVFTAGTSLSCNSTQVGTTGVYDCQ